MAVAREGMTVSGSRRRLYAISRASWETTRSPCEPSSPESWSAKLSPTQLASRLLEVFSNGMMSTTSPRPCAAAREGTSPARRARAARRVAAAERLNIEITLTTKGQKGRGRRRSRLKTHGVGGLARMHTRRSVSVNARAQPSGLRMGRRQFYRQTPQPQKRDARLQQRTPPGLDARGAPTVDHRLHVSRPRRFHLTLESAAATDEARGDGR